MNYYQARIAIDSAELLEELKNIYEEQSGVTVTKGNVVMKAYEDSLWVTNWRELLDEPIKLKNQYEISPNSLKLRIQISEEVESGIKNLKNSLKEEFKTRNVTIGVCLKLIFKAAYKKNTEHRFIQTINNDKVFEKYKEKASYLFDNKILDEVISLLNELQHELK